MIKTMPATKLHKNSVPKLIKPQRTAVSKLSTKGLCLTKKVT